MFFKITFWSRQMLKRLIRHGNSSALVIDKPIMEMLNITSETTFELSTDGKNLILSPQSENTQEKNIMKSLEKINKKYGNVLKKLGE
jgi:antitoxin component of MazEF toxin-antitoxin module